jgi:M-phase inducer tyrosine phosphatase
MPPSGSSPRILNFGFCQPQQTPPSPADDAMDIDTSFVHADTFEPSPRQSFAPSSPVPLSAAPTITQFNNLFYDTMSPACHYEDSPSSRQPKKRRSLSPESVRRPTHEASSSPAPPSSPTARKLERMSSGPLPSHLGNKPMLQGLGSPSSNALKRPRRTVLSAAIYPSDAPQSAYPILTLGGCSSKDNAQKLPPVRRAFSALLQPTGLGDPSSDDSSLDGPDMSSPAQAYAKRQSVRTIRRCDGTDDFRPLTGATAMVQRDMQESPSASGAGMPGFGDNEAHGKILPCHRVTEDGLMRINSQTVRS